MVRIVVLFAVLISGCSSSDTKNTDDPGNTPDSPYIVILGIAQDAGYPQAGCYQTHCMRAWKNPSLRRYATSIALVDPSSRKKWLFEATPDIKDQLFLLQDHAPDSVYELAGIFLTHAHIGHYTGLMHFGREVMGASAVPVYAMPRMSEYLKNNGPWGQLVELGNIELIGLGDSLELDLAGQLKVMPFTVPHRDEYSETVGYRITCRNKNLVFIPDIDKWHKWEHDINHVIRTSDHALLDATFFDVNELPGRDMREIPHPFVRESMMVFDPLPFDERSKVHFIHFNHSNPLLIEGSNAQATVREAGFNLARQGELLHF